MFIKNKITFFSIELNSETSIMVVKPSNFNIKKSYSIFLVFDCNSLLSGPYSILNEENENKIFIGIDFLNDTDRFNKLSIYKNYELPKILDKNNNKIYENHNNDFIGGNALEFNNFINNFIINKILLQENIKIKDLNLLGCSMGAYFILQMLFLNSQNIFTNAFLFSPSIWFNHQILNDLENNNLNQNKQIKINLWVGLKEPKLFAKKIAIDYYQDALKLKELLELKNNVSINFIVDPNGAHGFKWWSDYIIKFIL